MIFSSISFLFYFLPILLLLYFVPKKLTELISFAFNPTKSRTAISLLFIPYHNIILTIFSLLFFAWSGWQFLFLFLISVAFNYFIGISMSPRKNKFWFYAGIGFNVVFLFYYKYIGFVCQDLLAFLNLSILSDFQSPLLPIGISFYSFHAISYLCDIESGKVRAQKNFALLLLYISFFPQLIAGPIIRYSTFEPQLFHRTLSIDGVANGFSRFIQGLGKKVLLANTLGRIADACFNSTEHRDGLWLIIGTLSYTLQLYFDFSGYSDMAIGLSKVFGFEFPENFRFPYIAMSIQDFWRRWHISLSSFFKDYVYIPLGGNRKGQGKTIRNLLLVFFLTGLWHGANFTFIVWGILHGFFLLLEKTSWGKVLERMPKIVQRLYTLILVALLWIPFRASNCREAWSIWKSIFTDYSSVHWEYINAFMSTDQWVVLFLSLVLALFPMQEKKSYFFFPLVASNWKEKTITVIRFAFLLLILFSCTLFLTAGTYNPFIYYQF